MLLSILLLNQGTIVAGRGVKVGMRVGIMNPQIAHPNLMKLILFMVVMGEDGGNAILANYAITIDNNGTISGGGGGGGRYCNAFR